MSKRTGSYPPSTVDTTAKRIVSHAGAVLLVATAGKVGSDRALSEALAPWRQQWAVLDPGKILLDLAISVATHFIATGSGHGIQVRDPDVVVAAVNVVSARS